jgi:3-oxoacyl-[acyl-carrier-protein] synthase II
MAQRHERDVLITGIGLISSLGEGLEAHWDRLTAEDGPAPTIDAEWFPPYSIHPMVELDFSRYIPKRSDQRQMEMWQRIGCYAAGMALADAGVAGNAELLDRTNLNVAAGSGERDTAVDRNVLETIATRGGLEVLANEILPGALKPTLFLAQLANLLAGNISIIHNVTGASRTFMGEEMAGMSAVEDAWRRIKADQGDLFLVGGALNAKREDLLLNLELGSYLWSRPFALVWDRVGRGGGMVLGSIGAFLVLESRSHAEARGAKAYGCLADLRSGRAGRTTGEVAAALARMIRELGDTGGGAKCGPLLVLSGASGAEPALTEELAALEDVATSGRPIATRCYGNLIGHTLEAHFPAGIALAALAVSKGRFLPPLGVGGIRAPCETAPQNVIVTGTGHWRGEAAASVRREDRS